VGVFRFGWVYAAGWHFFCAGLLVDAMNIGAVGQKPYSKSFSVGAMSWLLMRGGFGFQSGVRGMWNGYEWREQVIGLEGVDILTASSLYDFGIQQEFTTKDRILRWPLPR
jgi:hypothetical protein